MGATHSAFHGSGIVSGVSHKPLIGVTSPVKGGTILWLFTRFAIWLSGGIAVRLHSENMTQHDWQRFHGFVIGGGNDIHPSCYGESILNPESNYDQARDGLEQKIITYAIEQQKPLLGICRGMQMMNVARGGTLHAEASDILEDFLPNRRLISKILGRRTVTIEPSSMLYTVLGGYATYRVNSIHHQAVRTLGDGFRIVAHEEHKLVQAIESSEHHPYLVGVQWHPELMLHAASARRLFKHLVIAAKG